MVRIAYNVRFMDCRDCGFILNEFILYTARAANNVRSSHCLARGFILNGLILYMARSATHLWRVGPRFYFA